MIRTLKRVDFCIYDILIPIIYFSGKSVKYS